MTPRKPHRRASGGTVPRSAPAPEGSATAKSSAEPAKGSTAPDQGHTVPAPEGSAAAKSSAEPEVLKVKATDDDPRVWGDAPEDRDSWLLEQRPPHWD